MPPAAKQRFYTPLRRTGLGKGGICKMSFRAFADAVRDRVSQPGGMARDLYLQQPLVRRPINVIRADQIEVPAGISDELHDDVLQGVGWRRLFETLERTGRGHFTMCQLWAGHGSGNSPCHYDDYDNFLCQVLGGKRVLLLAPHHSFALYPHALAHPMHHHSMLIELRQLAHAASRSCCAQAMCSGCPGAGGTLCSSSPGECLTSPSASGATTPRPLGRRLHIAPAAATALAAPPIMPRGG